MTAVAGWAMVAVLCATTGDVLPWWFFALLTLGMVGYLVANIVVAPALDRRWRKKHPDTGVVELIRLLNSITWHGVMDEDDSADCQPPVQPGPVLGCETHSL